MISEQQKLFEDIRAYIKTILDLQKIPNRTAKEVDERKEKENGLLEMCKKYYDKFERDNPLPITYKPQSEKETGIIISNSDAEALLNGFSDLQDDFRAYIRGESIPFPSLPKVEFQKTDQIQTEQKFIFKKSADDAWRIVFDGKDLGYLKNKGFAYMYYCIEREGKDISSIDLEKEVKPAIAKTTKIAEDQFDNEHQAEDDDEQKSSNQNKRVTTDHRAVFDKQAITEIIYKKKCLDVELKELEDQEDTPERNILIKEQMNKLETINKQLNTNTFKGKTKIFQDEVTKIQSRVSIAIDRAIEKLKDKPEVYEHFKRAFNPIHSPSHHYKPAEKINWILN